MLNTDAREQMIEQQVRAWDVLDGRVLELLRRIPREHFVPPAQRVFAFADLEVPLPHGQHMLRPSVAGRLLQALELTGTERALEIGAGSGFVTACIAAAARQVHSFEVIPELAALSRENLASLGVRNAEITTGDGLRLDGRMRYGAIAVTASMPVYEKVFQSQLEIGGRLFVVVGEDPVMDARLVRRTSEDAWTTTSLFETVIDPMINAPRPPEFRF
jgi:protein-L-isoaspartate(D-aspartate) O-methyltransferase